MRKIKSDKVNLMEHVERMEVIHPTVCSTNPKLFINVRAGTGAFLMDILLN